MQRSRHSRADILHVGAVFGGRQEVFKPGFAEQVILPVCRLRYTVGVKIKRVAGAKFQRMQAVSGLLRSGEDEIGLCPQILKLPVTSAEQRRIMAGVYICSTSIVAPMPKADSTPGRFSSNSVRRISPLKTPARNAASEQAALVTMPPPQYTQSQR